MIIERFEDFPAQNCLFCQKLLTPRKNNPIHLICDYDNDSNNYTHHNYIVYDPLNRIDIFLRNNVGKRHAIIVNSNGMSLWDEEVGSQTGWKQMASLDFFCPLNFTDDRDKMLKQFETYRNFL